MQFLSKRKVVNRSFSNLEVLLATLSLILMIYLGSIVPGYLQQIERLHEEKIRQNEWIEALNRYSQKHEEWQQRKAFIDLQIAGYHWMYPQVMDEYALGEELKDYLIGEGAQEVVIQFKEVQESETFNKWIYSVQYRSSQSDATKLVHKVSQLLEGGLMEELKLETLSDSKVMTEMVLSVSGVKGIGEVY